MTATLRDSGGVIVTGRPIIWKTSDTNLATVSDSGLVTARREGPVFVTATVEGVSGSAALIVLTPVRHVTVSPGAAILVPGGRLAFEVVLDGGGVQLFDRFVTWTTGNPTIATVSQSGDVVGATPGVTTLAAVSEGVVSNAVDISVTMPAFVALAAGSQAYRTCGRTATGTVYCWGDNVEGALGTGVEPQGDGGYVQDTLFGASPVGITHPQTFFWVTLGTGFSCGLVTDPFGTAYCWGAGYQGELGAGGSTLRTLTPTPVQAFTTFAAASAGYNHACAIAADSLAWCWGRSPGLGTYSFPNPCSGPGPYAYCPQPVDGGLRFTTLGAGYHLTCGLEVDSLAYCWGIVIGNDTASSDPGPHPVNGGMKYLALAVGQAHACGIATDRVTYCWGDNGDGQLGTGNTTPASVPAAIAGGHQFVSLTAGGATTCGLTAAGVAYCWGNDTFRQLGTDGGETCSGQPCSTTPQPVSGGLVFQSLAAGEVHTCGITAGGVAYCWGANGLGQLGDGTHTNRTAPTRVAGQP